MHFRNQESTRGHLNSAVIRALPVMVDTALKSDQTLLDFGSECVWFLTQLVRRAPDQGIQKAANRHLKRLIPAVRSVYRAFLPGGAEYDPAFLPHNLFETFHLDAALFAEFEQAWDHLTEEERRSVFALDRSRVDGWYVTKCLIANACLFYTRNKHLHLAHEFVRSVYVPRRRRMRYSYDNLYSVTHVYFTLTTYGEVRIPEEWLARELQLLYRWYHAKQVRTDDWEDISELLECFQRVELRTPEYVGFLERELPRYYERALDEQLEDGSWYVRDADEDRLDYAIYHTALTVVDVIKPVRQSLPDEENVDRTLVNILQERP